MTGRKDKAMIRFAVYKADGSKCYYVYESEDTIRNDYLSENCILPHNDDAIIYFQIGGVPLCVDCFFDIIVLLGIETATD